MFRVSQHPSSGVQETVTAASGTGHNVGTATSFQRGRSGASPIFCQLELNNLLFNCTCMYVQGSPFGIQTPTNWNLIGRSMTALPPVLSPSSILPPHSHFTLISARKIPPYI